MGLRFEIDDGIDVCVWGPGSGIWWGQVDYSDPEFRDPGSITIVCTFVLYNSVRSAGSFTRQGKNEEHEMLSPRNLTGNPEPQPLTRLQTSEAIEGQ